MKKRFDRRSAHTRAETVSQLACSLMLRSLGRTNELKNLAFFSKVRIKCLVSHRIEQNRQKVIFDPGHQTFAPRTMTHAIRHIEGSRLRPNDTERWRPV